MTCPRCNGNLMRANDLFCLACGEIVEYGEVHDYGQPPSTWHEENQWRDREYSRKSRAKKKLAKENKS